MKIRPASNIFPLIQVHEYEKVSIELSFCHRNYVANNVMEVHNIDTKDKFTDPFTKVLLRNLSHQFYHV